MHRGAVFPPAGVASARGADCSALGGLARGQVAKALSDNDWKSATSGFAGSRAGHVGKVIRIGRHLGSRLSSRLDALKNLNQRDFYLSAHH